jgi:cation diffusion facilitator family transporter
VAAAGANLGIAIAKLIGFVITGSSSMLAESVHSVADTTNQGLLLLGRRTSRRVADAKHPFGYGRDRYFYAFIVAMLLFSVGSIFATYEGIHKIQHPEDLKSPFVAIGILVVAIGLESFSFYTAIVESKKVMGRSGWVRFIRSAKDPDLPVVLLEDAGALFGLVFALAGVSMTLITGDPVWDGIGTLAIGVLLGIIAVILIIEMKSLLIGEGVNPDVLDTIIAELESGKIERVIHIRTQYLGPDELLVAAKIAMNPGLDLREVAKAIDDAELRLRDKVPVARLVYLEPDLDRSPSVTSS